MNLISFKTTGAFSAFRDPSITSNQTVYYIPSKSAIVGILGAIIGIPRSNKLGELFSKEYLEFFKNVKIGLRFESEPKKTVFFTNHRSLKEAKTKPFKTELVENPVYTIFVDVENEIYEKISNALVKNEFVYPPYLGHAYCLAKISNFKQIPVKKIEDVQGCETQSVILDESKEYEQITDFKPEVSTGTINAIVERHIHHFFDDNDKFDARILKHWIPTNNTSLTIRQKTYKKLTRFYQVENHVICTY